MKKFLMEFVVPILVFVALFYISGLAKLVSDNSWVGKIAVQERRIDAIEIRVEKLEILSPPKLDRQ